MTDQELIEAVNRKFVSVNELARRKNAHFTSVYGAIRAGKLTARKIWGITVIPVEQANSWNLKRESRQNR